jgi:hypothetical protein
MPEGYDAVIDPISANGKNMAQKFWGPQNPVLTGTVDELDVITQVSVDIRKYVFDSVDKFIAGDMDIESDWDTFNKTIQQMGFDKWEKVINDQYARWMARGK